jgi:hypothetical protein
LRVSVASFSQGVLRARHAGSRSERTQAMRSSERSRRPPRRLSPLLRAWQHHRGWRAVALLAQTHLRVCARVAPSRQAWQRVSRRTAGDGMQGLLRAPPLRRLQRARARALTFVCVFFLRAFALREEPMMKALEKC